MAFPTSPIDGQQYTNALGTLYQYYAADTAWKIVGGGGGGNITGSGTAGMVVKFTDTTTIGNSNIRSIGTDVIPINSYKGAGTDGFNIIIGDDNSNFTGSSSYGSCNTAVGSSALHFTTYGLSNTAVGYYAGYANINGIFHTCIGQQAGSWPLRSGMYGTYIGYNATPGDASAENETVVGASVTGHGSNTVTIGKSDQTTYLSAIKGMTDSSCIIIPDNGLTIKQTGLDCQMPAVMPIDSAAVLSSNTDTGTPIGGLNIFGQAKDQNSIAGIVLLGTVDAVNPTSSIPLRVIGGAFNATDSYQHLFDDYKIFEMINGASYMFQVYPNKIGMNVGTRDASSGSWTRDVSNPAYTAADSGVLTYDSVLTIASTPGRSLTGFGYVWARTGDPSSGACHANFSFNKGNVALTSVSGNVSNSDADGSFCVLAESYDLLNPIPSALKLKNRILGVQNPGKIGYWITYWSYPYGSDANP